MFAINVSQYKLINFQEQWAQYKGDVVHGQEHHGLRRLGGRDHRHPPHHPVQRQEGRQLLHPTQGIVCLGTQGRSKKKSKEGGRFIEVYRGGG